VDIAIDRKSRYNRFWFLQEPEFFEHPFTSSSPLQEYRQIATSLVPSNWRVGVHGIWLHASPSGAWLPLQGFKIHISGTSVTATELLRRVGPVCVENQAAFKVIADPFVLELTTSKHYFRGASGKFITIYPRDDEHFARLLVALDEVTASLAGPYILSDKRYANNKVLFYRYGGFVSRDVLNIFGEKVPVINAADGRLVPDIRAPYFRLPEGIADPFESENLKDQNEARLNNRYLVTEVIVHSNDGGVYKAKDQHTGQTVIVKEARPFIN